ncbi:hypothetical protein [Nostoc sp. FACHB-888]|uniref:IS1/IS1595 family N-terminal zinc-binding domain-containing protein n=1 Tax=Nostoc sp. FACHB-888 TaxID=2692842 RepID=UPI00168678AB|nr:hypothetical protein [Nostoc sp. FACHB-888]MBD2249063.1 hypothetical protein [Nostoc sp. FACHB-888]
MRPPCRFPGATEQSRVGNLIIDYYSGVGVVMDAVDWDDIETGYRLVFYVGRNGSRFIAASLLNTNDAPEKLKEVSGAMNTPRFKYNARGGHMVLEVQTRRVKKRESSQDEISKLWIPASKFEATVKAWTRVRITGGTESGKSPTAENLVVCILKNRPGTAKLYNPQHDSLKNYWTIPVAGTTHAESEKAIAWLAKKVDIRANGQESRKQFELWLFDEVDSTMRHTKDKKLTIAANINFIIKQASHQNLGAIFIGQNANISEYPGCDRSDWNSGVNVHIGQNCYDAITNSNQFTTDEELKLKQIADRLTEFCNSSNDELGLNKTDPNAYRFALVIEPNKKPYFIELPSFGCYTCNQITPVFSVADAVASQSTLTTDIAETPVNTSVANNVAAGIAVSCSSCWSNNIKKNGKAGSKQEYHCNDCGKNWDAP